MRIYCPKCQEYIQTHAFRSYLSWIYTVKPYFLLNWWFCLENDGWKLPHAYNEQCQPCQDFGECVIGFSSWTEQISAVNRIMFSLFELIEYCFRYVSPSLVFTIMQDCALDSPICMVCNGLQYIYDAKMKQTLNVMMVSCSKELQICYGMSSTEHALFVRRVYLFFFESPFFGVSEWAVCLWSFRNNLITHDFVSWYLHDADFIYLYTHIAQS